MTGERRAGGAGEVKAPLAPVEAGAAEGAAAAPLRLQVDAEIVEEGEARGRHLAAVGIEREKIPRDHRVGDADRERPARWS